MGGMGALALYLKNPGKYRSVSCFSPISHPTNMEWGRNAFEQYLGSVEAGNGYDPTLLVSDYFGPKTKILFDQGSHDKFLANLQPEKFLDAAHKAGLEVLYNFREGYGHDYFYVASFIENHIEFHSRYLNA